jgi:hypothetical protein
MVAPAVTHRETLSNDLTRALARATSEGIVVYRRDTDTLGVATVSGGTWTRKPYVLGITGPGCGDLTCSCPAGAKGTTCKHLASGIFARKHHVYAVCPVGTLSEAMN